jgi:DHA1 family bicyclomycin/chloramphenicol resistance-like MFS transporter
MVFIGTLINCTGIVLSMLVFWLGLGSEWTFFGFMTFVGLGNGMTIPNATAGMLSVRPHLAGTASGLGGAIMLGGGAGLSALAGALLVEGSGPWPLLWIMLATAICAIIAIRVVIWRAAQLAGLDSA